MIGAFLGRLSEWSRYIDKELSVVVALILSLGFVMMTSASLAVAEKTFGSVYYFMNRQMIFIVLGLSVALVMYNIRIRFWEDLGVKMLPLILLLLILVLIPGIGKEVNGSRRWLDLGLFNLQISEVAKLAILMYMAGYVARHEKRIQSSPSFIPLLVPLLVLAVFSALFLLEPDFGTVVVVSATGIAMLFVGGIKIGRLAILVVGAIIVMLPLVFMGYRGGRIDAYLDPWANATGKGYQIVHSLMAIGDGGWLGAGLGGSVQKQFYLPEAHNDFIFAVLAEEFGFIGIVVILFLYGWLVKRAFTIGFEADKVKLRYGALVAYGIGFWMGFQILFHIGVNLALLPSKGLTLPLMSYGGSSMLITLVSIGILQRIYRESQSVLYGPPQTLTPVGLGLFGADKKTRRTRRRAPIKRPSVKRTVTKQKVAHG